MTYEEAKEELVEVYCRFDSDCPYRKGIDCDTICPYGKAIEALEKQIPKKPVDYEECGVTRYKTGRCSCCGEFVIQHYKHCPKCGRAIDWSK